MLTLLTELLRHLITTMKCLFKTKCLCCYQYQSMNLVKSAHLNVSLRRICQVFDIYVQSNQKFWDKTLPCQRNKKKSNFMQSNQKFWDKTLPCQRNKKKSNFMRLTEIRSDTASRQQSEMLCRQTDLHCTSRQSIYQMLKIDGGCFYVFTFEIFPFMLISVLKQWSKFLYSVNLKRRKNPLFIYVFFWGILLFVKQRCSLICTYNQFMLLITNFALAQTHSLFLNQRNFSLLPWSAKLTFGP